MLKSKLFRKGDNLMKIVYAVVKEDEMGNRIYKTITGTFERSLKNAELYEHPFGLKTEEGARRVRIFISEEAISGRSSERKLIL